MRQQKTLRVGWTGKRPARSLQPLFLAAVCALTLVSTSAYADAYDFVGRWMNEGQDSSGITGFVVTPDRHGLSMRIFGRCRNQDVCDWQVSRLDLYSTRNQNYSRNNWGSGSWGGFSWNFGDWRRDTNIATAQFDAGYATKFLVLRRAKNNELRVEIFTTSPSRDNRPGYLTETRFQRWGQLPSSDRGNDRNYRQDQGNDGNYRQYDH